LGQEKEMSTNINHSRRIFSIAMSGLLLVGGMFMQAGTAAEPAAPAVSRPALAVRVATLREDKWARTLSANGSILPWQEAIISAQVQGLRIAEVKVGIGDHVQQGQVLVTLDNFAHNSDSSPSSRRRMPSSVPRRSPVRNCSA
jgi:multidrug efflux pump subunit AcrA (membrane-fusion protein)